MNPLLSTAFIIAMAMTCSRQKAEVQPSPMQTDLLSIEHMEFGLAHGCHASRAARLPPPPSSQDAARDAYAWPTLNGVYRGHPGKEIEVSLVGDSEMTLDWATFLAKSEEAWHLLMTHEPQMLRDAAAESNQMHGHLTSDMHAA